MIRQISKSTVLFLLGFFFLLPLSTCFGQVPSYQINETELQELESIFRELENINNQLEVELRESKQDLSANRKRLAELNLRLDSLRNELTTARAELAKANDSLKEANQLFDQYAKEAKSTEKRVKRQRDLYALLAIVLGSYGALK